MALLAGVINSLWIWPLECKEHPLKPFLTLWWHQPSFMDWAIKCWEHTSNEGLFIAAVLYCTWKTRIILKCLSFLSFIFSVFDKTNYVLLSLQNPDRAPRSEPTICYKAQILPHTHHAHTDTCPVPTWEADPPNSGTQLRPWWVVLPTDYLFIVTEIH